MPKAKTLECPVCHRVFASLNRHTRAFCEDRSKKIAADAETMRELLELDEEPLPNIPRVPSPLAPPLEYDAVPQSASTAWGGTSANNVQLLTPETSNYQDGHSAGEFFHDPHSNETTDTHRHAEGEIKVKYHPHAECPDKFMSAAEYRRESRSVDDVPMQFPLPPWSPFLSRIDFEIAKLLMDAGMNKALLARAIALFRRCQAAESEDDVFSITDYAHLRRMWRLASTKRTGFQTQTVSIPFKGQEHRDIDVQHRPAWKWTLDVVRNPQFKSALHWDASRHFRFTNGHWTRIFNKPWTGNHWWNLQSSLPKKAKPLMYILYADKARLSSFGTAKGYPVIMRIANLDSDIVGWTAQVVGWIKVVDEESEHRGKPFFVDYKNRVWHGSVAKVIESLLERGRVGETTIFSAEADDDDALWLFTRLLILSADYEEQSVMNLIRGLKALFPCPRCFVTKKNLSDLSLRYPLRNVEHTNRILEAAAAQPTKTAKEAVLKKHGLRDIEFENAFKAMKGSDYHNASSFDTLHTNHGGIWNDHMKVELQRHVQSLGRQAAMTIDARAAAFPRWRDLNHIERITTSAFTDGSKNRDIAKIFFFASHDLFELESAGHLLLRALRSHLNFAMYVELQTSSEETIAAARNELQIFHSIMKEYASTTHGTQYEKNWNFIKMHLRLHALDDIEEKGASRGMSTKPYEHMHGPLKKIYQRQTNFKNTADQILKIEHQHLVATVMQEQLNVYDRYQTDFNVQQEPGALDYQLALPSFSTISSASQYDEAMTYSQTPANFPSEEVTWQRICLGSAVPLVTFKMLEETKESNAAFHRFRHNLGAFLYSSLPGCGYSVPSNAGGQRFRLFEPNEEIQPYQLLTVKYESASDWSIELDHLRAHPKFHNRARYDAVIAEDPATHRPFFARLEYIFSCRPISATSRTFVLALVQPFDPVTQRSQHDRELGYLRLQPRHRAGKLSFQFIFVETIIRGALLVPTSLDKKHQVDDECIVFDVLDDDMFVRVRRDFPATTSSQPIAESDLDIHIRDGPSLDQILSDLQNGPSVGEEEEDGLAEKDDYDPMMNNGFLSLFADDSDPDLGTDGLDTSDEEDSESGEYFDFRGI